MIEFYKTGSLTDNNKKNQNETYLHSCHLFSSALNNVSKPVTGNCTDTK